MKLTSTTIHGTFARTTDTAYTHIAVWANPDRSPMRLVGAAGIAAAKKGLEGPTFLATWHRSERNARQAQCGYNARAEMLGIFPVDGTPEAEAALAAAQAAADEAANQAAREAAQAPCPRCQQPLDLGRDWSEITPGEVVHSDCLTAQERADRPQQFDVAAEHEAGWHALDAIAKGLCPACDALYAPQPEAATEDAPAPASDDRTAQVQSYVRTLFTLQRENAQDALGEIIRTAQAELDRLAANPDHWTATDFVSQHATKYAAAVAAMTALSPAIGALNHLTAQEATPTTPEPTTQEPAPEAAPMRLNDRHRKAINDYARQARSLAVFSHCEIAQRCLPGTDLGWHENLAYFGLTEAEIGRTDLADFGGRLGDVRQVEGHPSGLVILDIYVYGRDKVGAELQLDTNVQAKFEGGALVALNTTGRQAEYLADPIR